MKKHFFNVLFILAITAVGCGSLNNRSQTSVLREANNIPGVFDSPAGGISGSTTCVSPLIDPRDGTELTMVTSFGDGIGDYAVPHGKYGVDRGELLRINCSTGEVIGIVRR